MLPAGRLAADVSKREKPHATQGMWISQHPSLGPSIWANCSYFSGLSFWLQGDQLVFSHGEMNSDEFPRFVANL